MNNNNMLAAWVDGRLETGLPNNCETIEEKRTLIIKYIEENYFEADKELKVAIFTVLDNINNDRIAYKKFNDNVKILSFMLGVKYLMVYLFSK